MCSSFHPLYCLSVKFQAVWLVRSKQDIIVSLICGLDCKTGNEYRIFVQKCLVNDYLGGRRR